MKWKNDLRVMSDSSPFIMTGRVPLRSSDGAAQFCGWPRGDRGGVG